MKKNIFLSILILFLISCGYKFSGQGSLPGGIKKLSISIFENRTGYAKVSSILKEEFVSEFSRMGVIASDDLAEGVLKGEIVRINISTASKKSSDSAFERRVSMVINVRIENSENKTVYERKGISDNYVFEASEGNSSGFGVPNSALEELCDKMSKKVASVITSNF